MARAAEAVDATRGALETQTTAMHASIEHSRATLESAGEDAARSLSERLDSVSGKIEGLAAHLAAQDEASHALVSGLGRELAKLERWFQQLGTSGTSETERLSGAIGAVRDSMGALVTELGGGGEQAGQLIERGREAAGIFEALGGQLQTELPTSLQANKRDAPALPLVRSPSR
jgi:hypothetical protein